jgi:hypothetical protein
MRAMIRGRVEHAAAEEGGDAPDRAQVRAPAMPNKTIDPSQRAPSRSALSSDRFISALKALRSTLAEAHWPSTRSLNEPSIMPITLSVPPPSL